MKYILWRDEVCIYKGKSKTDSNWSAKSLRTNSEYGMNHGKPIKCIDNIYERICNLDKKYPNRLDEIKKRFEEGYYPSKEEFDLMNMIIKENQSKSESFASKVPENLIKITESELQTLQDALNNSGIQ